jgi:ADP-ribose pyrophosphatase YjhB (NUDIX family)
VVLGLGFPVDNGERFEEAAIREFREETDLKANIFSG